ncbi:Protein 21.1 [Giardia lamblia P15]|uniref:Protein 21.1 n=1 Tax=Giardia intestinalis (strain P15) TaxID=658858 RepID=E1F9A1_GIAIA|nr:Protein 21.1 [Giardia lamblia P15]
MFSGFQDDWSQALTLEDSEQIKKLVGKHAGERNSKGQTALMLIAQQPFSKLASLLLPYSIHTFDPKGRTALHYAVEAKNTSFLELFLVKTWLKRDEDGMSPIETAIVHGNVDPLRFFLQHRMLLQSDLEAARILASEYTSKEIIELLANYNPLPTSSISDSPQGEDITSAKFDSSVLKSLITQVKSAISDNSTNVDELVCELLEKAVRTSTLGKVLTSFYSKRVKDLKALLSSEKQRSKRLKEDVDSGVSTLSTFIAEIQRLTHDAEERERIRAEAIDLSILVTPHLCETSMQTDNIGAEPTIDKVDEGIQCISLPCAECLRKTIALDKCNEDLENVKEKLRLTTTEIDEQAAKLQKITEERDEALDKFNGMVAASVQIRLDKEVGTVEVEKAIVDGYVKNLVTELRTTVLTLKNGGSENPDIATKVNESTLKTADELIRMVSNVPTIENIHCAQSLTDVLFSNLTIFLVELLKEKHIAKAAILEKVYLENAIQELHLTAHLDSKTLLSKGGKSLDKTDGDTVSLSNLPKEYLSATVAPVVEPIVVVDVEPNTLVSKVVDEEIDMLDDAEALGNSLSAKDLNGTDSPSKYTASFIKNAIREASSISSFTSDRLAELPQRSDDDGHRAPSDVSSTTLSSISFVSHNSNSSAISAPGGTRHMLTYGNKRSNAEAVINQMIKLSAERPIVSGKQLPLSVHSSTHVGMAPLQSTESKSEHDNTVSSEDPKAFFGKRNAELNKSTSYLLKSSYQPPIIADGRSPLKSIVADMSNCWIRNSSPLNKYNASMMKKSNPYEFYEAVLGKSRSTSTPLARSHGPDVTD